MLAAFVFLAAPGLAVTFGWWIARGARRRSGATAGQLHSKADIDPVDVADIDARFGDIERANALQRDTLLASRVAPLVDRCVPVRGVEAVPCMRSARIRFADGTALVARGAVPGDMGVLAAALRDHAVRPASWSTGMTGTRLVLGWSGERRRLSVVVTGLDQPD